MLKRGEPMSYRIALASIDGTMIDQHFRTARYWQIYDIDTQAHFIETRRTLTQHQHCDGGFGPLLTLLSDCDAIFVEQIGEAAALALISKGKRVFEAAGEVKSILAQLLEQGLLNGNI